MISIPRTSSTRRSSESITPRKLSFKARLTGQRFTGTGTSTLGCVALVALCSACSGDVTPMTGAPLPGTDGTAGQPTVDPNMPGNMDGPGPVLPGGVSSGDVQLRRLNVAEYRTTISDWLGIDVNTTNFPPDGTASGFDTVAASLAISQLHAENFEQAADAVVETLFSTDPGGVRATWCSYASGDAVADEACAAQIVSGFAERAWRRPHTSWGGNDGLATYQAGLSAAGPFGMEPLEIRLKQVLKSVLVGPRFLLRVEFTDANGQLDAPSLAARLSYMLWNSAPDAQSLASNLLDDNVLRTELNRMQFVGTGYTTQFERFLQRFPDMWLELGALPRMSRNAELFPDFTPELGSAMRLETQNFLRQFAASGSTLPLRTLLTAAPAASSDPALAALYGDSPRTGLLTQASILSVTSTESRTSAVRRGKWIMERLLCDPPPPPTPAIQAEIKAKPEVDEALPERERLAIHRADTKCAGCHQTMDVIGLGLENYDAVGAYRTVDSHGNPIDASGTLPGTDKPFTTPAELIAVIAEDPRLNRCMAQQLLTYGTGRVYTAADSALLDSIVTSAGGTEATFQRTLEAVVLSPAFRKRQGSI